MTTYSLIAAAEAAVHRLTRTGGSSLVSLAREAELISFGLCVEQLGNTLEAVITFAGTTNSITLDNDAERNARDLCDYIEALANGTAETATEAPSPAPRCCGDCEELSADLASPPGIHPVQIDAQAPAMPEPDFAISFEQDARLRRLVCEGGETVLPLAQGASIAIVVDPDQSATWQARIRTPDADLQLRLPASAATAHQNLIEHVERMAEAYRWTRTPIVA